MVLVSHGILELVESHGSVWFLNVLAKSPEEEKVFDVVLHASKGSESKVGLLGLGCKVKQGEEGGLQIEWFQIEVEVFSVFSQGSGVVEVIPVFLGYLDLGETCGLFDDGFVKDGVVECGFVLC